MVKVIEKSAKTVEDALKAALDELGVSEDEINYEIIEEPSKGLFGIIGTKPAKIRVTIKEIFESVKNNDYNNKNDNLPNTNNDIADNKKNDMPKKIVIDSFKNNNSSFDNDNEKMIIAENFLKDILNKMHLEVNIETQNIEDEYIFNLHGENLGILIGKHGQTLDALQYIVNLAANKNESINRLRFIIDIENYRSRRVEILQNLAKNLADRAIRMNQDVRLEPMTRHERKIIHSALQDNNRVITHSVGDDPHRYIIISPKKNGKPKNDDNISNES